MTGTNRFARRLAFGGVVAGSVALLAVPGSAFAGTASIGSDGIPRYDAHAGEINSVTVAELPGSNAQVKKVVFRDLVPVSAASPCEPVDAFAAACEMPVGTGLVRAALQDQNDRLEPDALNPPITLRFSAEGDAGNDTLIGTDNRDVLDGVGGDDNIFGRGGNDGLEGAGGDDDISGQDGDDTLTGGGQADDLNGGTGRDTMFGGTGNDNLNANDHAGGDVLDCGEHLFDNDLAVFNLGDTVASDCERTRVEA